LWRGREVRLPISAGGELGRKWYEDSEEERESESPCVSFIR